MKRVYFFGTGNCADMKQGIDIFQEKIKIFKIKQKRHIGGHSQEHACFPGTAAAVQMLPEQKSGYAKIPQDTATDNQHIRRIEVSIKPQGHTEKPQTRSPSRLEMIQEKINCHTQRQKKQNEYIRVKQHTRLPNLP